MQHKLIYKIAWGFSNQNPQLFEDLKSEATLAYLEAEQAFNPEKGILFTTFAYRCMQNRLIDYISKENRYFPTEEFPDQGYQQTPFFEILETLSKKAQLVATMVLENLPKYSDLTPSQVRGALRRDLADIGWSNRKQTKIINELKRVFN